MSTIVNVQQDEMWNGTDGEHWADNPDRWDAAGGGCNEYLLEAAAIEPCDRVLDVGCGNGQTTRLAASLAYDGFATGVDLSEPMLDTARRLAAEAGLANVGFERGDAQVHPFPSAGYDVAISRFGVMFFLDPVAGFANIGRALRPGGRLAFACPKPADAGPSASSVVFPVLDAYVPPLDGPPPVNLGALSDPDRTAELLTAAGFVQPNARAVEYPTTLGRDASDAAAFVLEWGLVRIRLWDARRTTVDRIRAALTDAFGLYETADGVRIPAHVWIVSAYRPSATGVLGRGLVQEREHA